jgi:hypothetical protein
MKTLRRTIGLGLLSCMAFVTTTSAGESKAVSAKEQCVQLMDSLLPFAEKMLKEHGEFFPFGGTVDAAGQIGMSGGWTGDEHPPSNDVIGLLQSGFKRGAHEGTYIAAALVYDVRVVPPGQSEKTDAIAVDVSHKEGISQTVIYPYKLQAGELSFGQSYAIANQHPVFEQ